MEVIQNADDTKYTKDETPTVFITVFPKHVKIECNEEGFSRDNILALCRTGRSSKTPGRGYTGEKGIGFKSVFKLAKRAHIRSPPYYFQLDQTRELGMITPQWDQGFFDRHQENHQTTIILDRICDPTTDFSTALQNDVEAIDPGLLLFLRQIERIHLRLFTSSSDGVPAISKRFHRANWTPNSGFVSLKDEDADTRRNLYKHPFTIDCDGTETQRRGITNTDIVLAFPVKNKSRKYVPLIQKTNFVFAYLPLGNFGFRVRNILVTHSTAPANAVHSLSFRQISSQRRIGNQSTKTVPGTKTLHSRFPGPLKQPLASSTEETPNWTSYQKDGHFTLITTPVA